MHHNGMNTQAQRLE